MGNSSWQFISVLDASNLQSFDCGVPELNDFLKKYAGQNQRKNLGNTTLLVPVSDSSEPAGYHTLSMAQVDLKTLAAKHRKGLPKYPAPAVRLARLAVDQKWQGKGLGETLLLDAIRRSVQAAQGVAAKYMIVDALNSKAAAFYHQYGFEPFESDLLSLVASLETLKAIL